MLLMRERNGGGTDPLSSGVEDGAEARALVLEAGEEARLASLGRKDGAVREVERFLNQILPVPLIRPHLQLHITRNPLLAPCQHQHLHRLLLGHLPRLPLLLLLLIIVQKMSQKRILLHAQSIHASDPCTIHSCLRPILRPG